MEDSQPHSEFRNLRAIVASGDRITPISRKTGTIMLGADAFSRAEDIEIGVYYELPCLFEQLEAYETALREIELASRKPDTAPGHFGYIARVVLPESSPAKRPT